MEPDLWKSIEIIDDYILLSNWLVSRRNQLYRLREKACTVNSDDDYVKLYEEACILREKFKRAKTDAPYYCNQLLRCPVIAARSVSQMKVCLGLKLCRGWDGKLKVCVIPSGLDLGLTGEIDDMKSFAIEWGLALEPNTSAKLLEGLMEISSREAKAGRKLATIQREAMQLPHDDEPGYAAYAAEAERLRKRIWAYTC